MGCARLSWRAAVLQSLSRRGRLPRREHPQQRRAPLVARRPGARATATQRRAAPGACAPRRPAGAPGWTRPRRRAPLEATPPAGEPPAVRLVSRRARAGAAATHQVGQLQRGAGPRGDPGGQGGTWTGRESAATVAFTPRAYPTPPPTRSNGVTAARGPRVAAPARTDTQPLVASAHGMLSEALQRALSKRE